jgi:hypothetical protein
MTEKIDHPAHYGGASSPFEVIKIVEEWGLGFHLGNALKYVARAGKKTPGDVLTDLKKARWYLDRAITQSSIVLHVNAKGPHDGFIAAARTAAAVWGLTAPRLVDVVEMIATAAGRGTWAYVAIREDLSLALDGLDKTIAALEGKTTT